MWVRGMLFRMWIDNEFVCVYPNALIWQVQANYCDYIYNEAFIMFTEFMTYWVLALCTQSYSYFWTGFLKTPPLCHWFPKQLALPQTHIIGWAVAVSGWSRYLNKQSILNWDRRKYFNIKTICITFNLHISYYFLKLV